MEDRHPLIDAQIGQATTLEVHTYRPLILPVKLVLVIKGHLLLSLECSALIELYALSWIDIFADLMAVSVQFVGLLVKNDPELCDILAIFFEKLLVTNVVAQISSLVFQTQQIGTEDWSPVVILLSGEYFDFFKRVVDVLLEADATDTTNRELLDAHHACPLKSLIFVRLVLCRDGPDRLGALEKLLVLVADLRLELCGAERLVGNFVAHFKVC